MKQPPSPALDAAYRNALYWVDDQAGPRWCLRVNQFQPELLHQYRLRGVDCACYLTACNPQGRLRDAAENARRMKNLAAQLQAADWATSAAVGEDPQQRWPGEASYLIWGMTLADAMRWGQAWQQNAILHCAADAVPRLVWMGECL